MRRLLLVRLSLCGTATLALTSCCDDIGCAGALNVRIPVTSSADRVEVVLANESLSCGADDQPAIGCDVNVEGDEISFSITEVPEGEITLRVFAADKMLSERKVTPVWKDVTPDNICNENTVCKGATVTLDDD